MSSGEFRCPGPARKRFARIVAFALASLLAWSLPVVAQDASAPSIDGLQAAMQARVNAISGIAGPSKAQKKEAKVFGKGLKQFAKYKGLHDKKDFKVLGKIAGIVAKSKTGDEDVLAQVEAVLATIDGVGIAARQIAEETRGFLSDEKALLKMDKFLAKGDASRLKGLQLWEVNFAKGAKKVAASVPQFQKAAVLAVEQKVIDADEIQNDVRPTGVTLLTRAPAKINHPIQVEAHYEIDQPSPELTVSLFANSVRTKSDGMGGLVPATQWEVGSETLLDVPAGAGSVIFDNQIPLWMFREDVELSGSDATNYLFGETVAADGDTVAVSARTTGQSGVVIYVYERNTGGVDTWGESTRIPVSYLAASLDLSGDTLIVGGGPGAGNMVRVFERNSGGMGAWGQVAELVAFDTSSNIAFGTTAAISGDWIAVGARTATISGAGGAGAVYLYQRDEGGAGAWGSRGKFTDPMGAEVFAFFGSAIALSDDILVIGAPKRDHNGVDAGQGYYYELDAGSDSWLLKFTLNVGSPAGALFGTSLAVEGDTLLVGAPGHDITGLDAVGEARIYFRTQPGSLFFGPQLLSHAPSTGDQFGSSVAFADDVAVVGAFGDDHSGLTNNGSVYLFVADQGGPGAWGQLERLSSSDPLVSAYGSMVAADGDVIVSGTTSAHGSEGRAFLCAGMQPILDGDYVLTVQVDPPMTADMADEGLIFERPLPVAESNNLFPANDGKVSSTVMFDAELINMPNITLESVVVTPDQIYVDTDSENIASFGATVTISMAGNFDGPVSGARLHIGMGITGVNCDSTGSPDNPEILIWDDAKAAYIPGLPFVPGTNLPHEQAGIPLPDLVSGETITLHAQLAFRVAYDDMSCVYDVEVPVIVWVPSFIEEVDPENPGNPTADNFILLPNISCNVVKKPSCSFSQGFEKSMGNDYFGASVGFRASLDMVKNIPGLGPDTEGGMTHDIYPGSEAEHGVVAGAEGGVSVELFGFNVDLVRSRTLVERDPVSNYGYAASELVFFDPFTLQEQVVYSVGPFDTIDLEGITKFPDGVEYDSVKGEISIEKTIDVGKKYDSDEITTKNGKKVSKPPTPKLFFGPIPVFVKATAEGSVGFTVKLTVGNAFLAEAFPFAKIQAGVEVDVGGIGVAGAEGKLILIEDQFRMAGGLGLVKFDHPPAPAATQSTGMAAGLCFQVANEINIFNGEVKVFARYPSISWCDGGTFFPDYPCGFRIRKWTKKLVEFTAHKDCRVLIKKVEPLCCDTLTGPTIPPGSCAAAPAGVCQSDVCDD